MLSALKTDFIRNQQLLQVTKFNFLNLFCDYNLVDLSCNLEMYKLNSYKFKNTTLGVRMWYASFHCAEDPISSHYNDVIMDAIASQITSLAIVYSTVYSDADQRKHQRSASLAFVRGIHRWPMKFLYHSLLKGPEQKFKHGGELCRRSGMCKSFMHV